MRSVVQKMETHVLHFRSQVTETSLDLKAGDSGPSRESIEMQG